MKIRKILSASLAGFVLQSGVAFASNGSDVPRHTPDGAATGANLGRSDQCEGEVSAKDRELIANFDRRLQELESLKSKGGDEYAQALEKLANEYSAQISESGRALLLAKINQKRLVDLLKKLKNDEKFVREYQEIQKKLDTYAQHFEKVLAFLNKHKRDEFFLSMLGSVAGGGSEVLTRGSRHTKFHKEYMKLHASLSETYLEAVKAIEDSTLDESFKAPLVETIAQNYNGVRTLRNDITDRHIQDLETQVALFRLGGEASASASLKVASVVLAAATQPDLKEENKWLEKPLKYLGSIAAPATGNAGDTLGMQVVGDVNAMLGAAIEGESILCALMASQGAPDRKTVSRTIFSAFQESTVNSLKQLVSGAGGASGKGPSQPQP